MIQGSIGVYIENLVKFLLFLAISLSIFAVFYFISRKASLKRRKIIFLKKDPFKLRNLFTAGLLLVMAIMIIFFISGMVVLIMDFSAGMPLYILIGCLFLILFISVYVVKSKILHRDR